LKSLYRLLRRCGDLDLRKLFEGQCLERAGICVDLRIGIGVIRPGQADDRDQQT
jgi:hypothetical protein